MSYPLGRHGSIIGTPHVGTHTLGNWQSDNAVDISVPVGTPVVAIADGTIGSNIGSLGRGGQFAGLRAQLNSGGNSWWYGHLSRLVVRAGQKVKAGDIIGYSGSANGVAHLHFAQQNGDPRSTISGKYGGGVATGKAGSGGVIDDIIAAPYNDPSQAPTPQADANALDIPGQIVSAFAGALGEEGAKILLWLVLVGGGTVLAVLGMSRLTGLKPTKVAAAAMPGARVAKAVT